MVLVHFVEHQLQLILPYEFIDRVHHLLELLKVELIIFISVEALDDLGHRYLVLLQSLFEA